MSLLPRWFDAQPFGRQVVLLALVCDPTGFAAGYLLALEFGVEPILGGVYGSSPRACRCRCS